MSENSNSNDAPINQPPAGWYADPHSAGGQRYWDGAQWTEHAVGSAAGTGATTAIGAAQPASAPVEATGGSGVVAVSAKRGLPKPKWWQWALVAVGVLVLIGMIVNGVNGGRGSSDNATGDESTTIAERAEAEEVEAPEPKPVDDREEVPGLVGRTVAEARSALEAAGFVIATPVDTGDDWVVATQTLSEGRKADAGTEVFVTAQAPKPVYTLAQKNAIGTAESYLRYSGFSRTGLIGQLEYEGFSTADATFGADNAGADWNAEAAESAESYLKYSSFSRQGLYDQLAYEGFTDAEIQYGLGAVGY